MSTKTIGATLLHAIAVVIMTWGYIDLHNTTLNSYIEAQKGGHLQFLTIQTLGVAWFTMVLSLAGDLLPTSQLLKNVKRAFFLVALPLSVVVTSIYWTLILFFPSLILQSAPAPAVASSSSDTPTPALARIALSLDLALHFVPAFALLADFFLFETSYGPRAAGLGATAMSAAFGVWYAVWVEYCASYNGTFPYPFLTVSPLPGRIVIYVIVTAIAFLSFRGINAAHMRLTGHGALVKEKAA